MPRFDGTGPMGYGPRTGLGRGFCGCGYGRGFGWRSLTSKEEKEILEDETKILQDELKAIKERLTEIEKTQK